MLNRMKIEIGSDWVPMMLIKYGKEIKALRGIMKGLEEMIDDLDDVNKEDWMMMNRAMNNNILMNN